MPPLKTPWFSRTTLFLKRGANNAKDGIKLANEIAKAFGVGWLSF